MSSRGQAVAWTFLNSSSLEETKSKKHRTKIRSHISKLQHARNRNPSLQHQQHSAVTRSTDGELESDLRLLKQCKYHHDVVSCKDGATNIPRPYSHTINSGTFQPFTEGCQDRVRKSHAEDLRVREQHKSTDIGLHDPFSRGSIAFRTLALRDPTNIIGTSLWNMQLELSSVMSLYKRICEVQAVDFAQQYAIGGEDGSWGRFYTFVFTDPVLLATAVLLGVRNQLDVMARPIQGRTFTGVVQIERFLIRGIHDALGESVRSISDQMLVAVALCAAYEIKHGTGACYHIHMQGLVQMIGLRGGLVAIGTPDPYIARLLTWFDINTSKLANREPYLQGMTNGLHAHPHANTAIFRTRG